MPSSNSLITPERLRHRLDTRTKPLGSLGQLETLAVHIGLVLQSETPRFAQPRIFVFAGDHGIAAEGVSAFPQAVTAQMVANYLSGGAAINVLARQHGIALSVINAGVATAVNAMSACAGDTSGPASLPRSSARDKRLAQPELIDRSIGAGTRNAAVESAMSHEQCDGAIAEGRQLAADAIASGSNVLMLGEMGIANTASASLVLHRLTNWPLQRCVGRGTGLDDAGLAHKLSVLERATARVPGPLSPTAVLREFGGFELAMIVGVILECAQHRCIAVIDGFAVSVCALLAQALNPRALEHCVFSHCSAEQAHRALLGHLGVKPVLDLGMRLGEGTGAALAWPVLDSSIRLMADMASFEAAGVSDRM